MRIKIYSNKMKKNIVMEVNVVEPYIHNEEKLCIDGIVFDVGGVKKVEELLDNVLRNGYLDLTLYEYMVLDGMVSWKIKL